MIKHGTASLEPEGGFPPIRNSAKSLHPRYLLQICASLTRRALVDLPIFLELSPRSV
jgi:hypothetical protein